MLNWRSKRIGKKQKYEDAINCSNNDFAKELALNSYLKNCYDQPLPRTGFVGVQKFTDVSHSIKSHFSINQ